MKKQLHYFIPGDKTCRSILWTLCLLLIYTTSSAQDITVKGIVTDAETKGPVPAVNISVKGTNVRTATNVNGAYTISNLSSNAVLVFTYIGYKQQEIALEGRTKLDVVLTSDYGKLDEVVVVGFGTKKKINIAGAIDQISGKALESRPVNNVLQGLQGLSPGLNITYAGGAPGSVPTVNIRGFTSINGGSPLIVIDGIQSTNDDLLRLTPSDITSFTVLKDAASAAIYGARAAFGVILVTTKQGSEGRNVISYNTFTAWGKPTLLPKPVTDPYIFSRVLETATDNTPWDYVNYDDAYYKWARERSDNPSVEDTRIDETDAAKPWIYMGSNDWYDYFFNKQSLSKSHTLTFSGGATVNNKPLTYYLSADYSKDNGLNKLTDDYWDRYGLRSKTGFSPMSWLKIDNNLNIYETKRALPNSSITDLYYLMPTDVAKNPDGTWANTAAGRMGARLVDGGNNLQTMFGFHNITGATALFFKGDLQVNGDASFKRELWKTHVDSKKYKIGYGPNDIREEGGTGSVTENNGYLYNNAFNLYTTYKKTIGDHFMSAMVGFNSENYRYSTVNASKDVLISSSLPYLSLTSGASSTSADYGAYASNSVFGRLNYTFKDRYILEGTGRYDGSSRFPTERRWGFFPSASAAWIASAEEFLKPLAPTLSTLKLRTSYGDLGNQNPSQNAYRRDFGYIYALPTGVSGYLIGGNGQNQIITGAPRLEVDPNTYTWERVSTLNMGADIGFLKDRFSITFDYFIRDTKGMLAPGQVLPGVLGTDAPTQNVADLSTKGWELSVAYRDRFDIGSKPFNFETKLMLSDSRSKITKFQNDQNLFVNYRVGQNIGEIWGLENDGLFQNQAEIDALDESAIIPWGALEIIQGWPKYKDLDGNHKIETGLSANDPKDLKVIGNSTDRYIVGANLNMDWAGFDLSVFLQGVLKRDFYPHHYLFWGPYQQPYANVYPWNLNYYRATGDSPEQRAKHSASYIKAGLADANTNSQYPVLQSWLADANYGAGLDIPQTKYLLNGAYLRIKNISLGYTLPVKFTNKFGVSRLRIYATGENLYEFSSIKKFVDPEAINQGSSAWAYPFQRRYAFGVNLDF